MGSEPRQTYRNRIYQAYQDSIARELEAGRGIDDPSIYHPSFRANYMPHVPQDRSARILDAGCGLGNFVQFLRREGYSNASGIDFSPQMAKLALGRGLPVEEAEACEYLCSRPGQFDCVLAMDVLEHLDKDELLVLLDAAHRGLKPGGCFLAHTVNADGFSWGRMRHIDLTHETAFTRYSLSQAFRVAGFSSCRFFPVEPVGPGFRAVVRRGLWKLFRLAAGLYYHVEMGSGIFHNDHILTASLVAKAVK